MGIRVELKHGRRWWYVVVDFGDGSDPVAKGPMLESDARAMAAELEAEAAKVDGVTVRERSVEEERRDRIVGFVALGAMVLVTVAAILTFLVSAAQ